MLLATLLGLLAPWSPTLGVLILVELAIGAAWAVFSVVTLVIELSLGGANSAGTPAGMIFSALAAAAVLRLALSWAGLPNALARGWFIAACWMLEVALALLAGLQIQRLGLGREGPHSRAATSR
jgi:Na+/pantothenate symporter